MVEAFSREKEVQQAESEFLISKRQTERMLHMAKIEVQEHQVGLCRKEVSEWNEEIIRMEAKWRKRDKKARTLGERVNTMKIELMFKEGSLVRAQAELNSLTKQYDTIGKEVSEWNEEIIRMEAKWRKRDEKARTLGERVNTMKIELMFKEGSLVRAQTELNSLTEQYDTIGYEN
ncbi:hypothetical protein K1719_033468 [Acacia pycnantha]|nr:hypothetical protein K1719_033468 [Acacia pycnantha]